MNRWLSKAAALLTILAASRLSRRVSSPTALPGQLASPVVSLVIKHPWMALGAVATLLAVGAFVLVVSGVVPIKASSGHWRISEKFMQFAKRRSVATHSIGIKVPPLDDRAMILKGAGHFEGGCRPCHGRPGEPLPRIPQAMTPKAPPLGSRIGTWNPAELFYIVKHGIKLTGMPAWPTLQRDDEVWAMVAFLRVFPDLDSAEYLKLVNGDIQAALTTPPVEALAPAAVVASCGRCHGANGRGREVGAFPRLAGQSETYLLSALRAFAGGTRHSGIMASIATGLDEHTMREVALYYSRLGASGLGAGAAGSTSRGPQRGSRVGVETQDPALGMSQPDPSAAMGSRPRTVPGSDPGTGTEIAERGIPAKKVPSCADCHGPTKTDRNPAYPELAGQYAEYLVLQLQLFARQQRGGSAYAHLMPPVAAALTTEEMLAVAQYYASFPR